MWLYITLAILLVTATSVILMRIWRPAFGYVWIVASVGAWLAWVSVWLWQLRLPWVVAPSQWQPISLFTTTPALQGNGITWAFTLALTTLCLAVVLSAPLRVLPVNPLLLSGSMILTAIGVLAVTAQNPLTLLLAWGALDLAELAITLRTFEIEQQSEGAVFAFGMRAAGIGLVMWANATSRALGLPFEFETVSPQVSIILLLAAAFRLGVFPLHLPYAGMPVLRRGLGSVIRLVSAAASLSLLARLPQNALPVIFAPWAFLLLGVIAIYAGWRWFRASNELSARPYWVIGMGALAVFAALAGNSAGSTALGIVLILLGSQVFLYSHANKPARNLALMVLFTAIGLPFTLTAPLWMFKLAWWLWLFPIGAQVLLVAGFARFMLMEKPMPPVEQTWPQFIYPVALGLPTLTAVALSLWGWDGARQNGLWWLGLIITALTSGLIWLRARLKLIAEGQREPMLITNQPLITPAQVSASIWAVYYSLRRMSNLIAQTFEGDGGILWTLLLLVLLITVAQGGR